VARTRHGRRPGAGGLRPWPSQHSTGFMDSRFRGNDKKKFEQNPIWTTKRKRERCSGNVGGYPPLLLKRRPISELVEVARFELASLDIARELLHVYPAI